MVGHCIERLCLWVISKIIKRKHSDEDKTKCALCGHVITDKTSSVLFECGNLRDKRNGGDKK